MYLVCYDIADNRRRRRMDKLLSGYGVRAQRSVFECAIDAQQAEALEAEAAEVMDAGLDRLHIYHLCDKDCAGRQCHGVAEPIEPLDYYLE
ncbi:CRISPR-associated endonuclease Cas2 [Methylomagnum sp.]